MTTTIGMINKFCYGTTRASLLLVLILIFSGIAFSQDSVRVKPKVESKDIPELFKTHPSSARPTPKRPEVLREGQRLVLARRLIAQKNYADAATVLENLATTGEDTPNIENLLLTCYTKTGNHLMAERLLRSMTTKHPNSLGLVMQLAEQLILLDQKKEGLGQYLKAIKLADPRMLIQSDHVLRSMIEHGLENRATEIIDSIRTVRNDDALYAVRRGTIMERQANYAAAASEYYRILDRDTTSQAITAERRLLSMLKFPASTKQVETTLLQQVRLTGNQAVLKLLNSHYINAGQFDYAFELSVQQDSLLLESRPEENDTSASRATVVAERQRGSLLLQFILQCADRDEHDQIIRMANYMKDGLPSSTFTMQATIYKADALNNLKQYDEAIATYQSSFDEVLDQPGQADLLYRIGDVYMNGLRDYPAALASFDSVTAHYPRGMGFLNSLQTIPLCHFRMGEMSLAADGFKQLSGRFQTDRDKESHEFFLALIDLAQKQYDSCGAKFEKLVVIYPNGMYVNDAVELMMINRQSAEKPDLREKLFEALIYDWRRLPDSARIAFREIANRADTTMADFALYRLAKMELELGHEAAAIASAEQLINRFEASYFFPVALKIKADILVRGKNDIETASALYRRILSDYPNYPFSSQVRKALRLLETSAEQEDQTSQS